MANIKPIIGKTGKTYFFPLGEFFLIKMMGSRGPSIHHKPFGNSYVTV